jgi:AraC-like DNA-binding protein
MIKYREFVGENAIVFCQIANSQCDASPASRARHTSGNGQHHLPNGRGEYESSYINQYVLNVNRHKGYSREEFIIEIINFMKENIDKKLTLNKIASCSYYSPTHLSGKFKRITGYSPIEYFNHLKLQKACYLLQYTQKRISDISWEIGIEDPYYFSRLFSKYIGISPSEYRNSQL